MNTLLRRLASAASDRPRVRAAAALPYQAPPAFSENPAQSPQPAEPFTETEGIPPSHRATATVEAVSQTGSSMPETRLVDPQLPARREATPSRVQMDHRVQEDIRTVAAPAPIATDAASRLRTELEDAQQVHAPDLSPHLDADPSREQTRTRETLRPQPRATHAGTPMPMPAPLVRPDEHTPTQQQAFSLAAAPLSDAGSNVHEPTEVHVHIGRIEVTAAAPSTPPAKQRRSMGKTPMSLEDYLARKRGGGA